MAQRIDGQGADFQRVHAIITGRVQGVSYRWYTQREAERLGLTGWVRNKLDGSVELVAEGSRADLDALLRWCEGGPPMAAVSAVQPEFEDAQGEFPRFTIRH